MKKQKVNWKIVCSAIAGITILEGIALFQGINGTMFSISVALIAGLAGYLTPSKINVK